MRITSLIASVATLFSAFSLAGPAAPLTGSMTYAPTAAVAPDAVVQAVPIPALFLIPLGLLLAVIGFRVLKANSNAVVGVLLGAAGIVAVVSGGVVVQDAIATIAETELSDPNGTSIEVPEGLHQYRNTSGVQLKITEITPPCPVSNTASSACVADGEIAIDGICGTEYVCTPPAPICPSGDTDGDGVCNEVDACPLDNPDDTDGDGICDSDDPCPLDNPDDTDGNGQCGTQGSPEICNGVDDDLNNLIDDGLNPSLSGVDCGVETPVCNGASGWGCPAVCLPNCDGKTCGDDECGGSCGSCGGGTECIDFLCELAPD